MVVEYPKTLRIYETMNDANEECSRRVQMLQAALGINPSVPERSNSFRQVGDDCGFGVMHYLEAEVRQQAREGWGSCPAVSSVRKNGSIFLHFWGF